MENTSISTFANSSEAFENATFSSTIEMPTASRQTVSPMLVIAMSLVVMGIGSCANSVVLAVLIRARREFGSSVHTLIANQALIDLFSCASGVATIIVMLLYRYNGNEILDDIICVIFGGGAWTGVGRTAESIGLMVITLERYFKIVHAIAHRKYYRDWMTKVGVALPWIIGIC